MTENETQLAQKLFQVFASIAAAPQKFPNSGTAQLFREKKAAYFRARAVEEFAELEGVAAGTHHHCDDPRADFVLESGQVFYWHALAMLAEQKSFAEFSVSTEIKKLLEKHAEQKIPLAEMLEKELAECKEKGYTD